jgi:hypothetical protein
MSEKIHKCGDACKCREGKRDPGCRCGTGDAEWGIGNEEVRRANALAVGTSLIPPNRCRVHGHFLEDGICPDPRCELNGVRNLGQ